jgi:hypothetical protein
MVKFPSVLPGGKAGAVTTTLMLWMTTGTNKVNWLARSVQAEACGHKTAAPPWVAVERSVPTRMVSAQVRVGAARRRAMGRREGRRIEISWVLEVE